ncbi:glycosyltransferase family 32 protein [Acetobacter thailandicus]|uniref:hypothetical protein n=1 Tax=Acetobacter thailandicus TaxID=1502842 RepID=UPI001BADA92E|nr:hypothetical protein [Acetobacter thailandicus]MBS0960891.1 hypothetical protein [Acetobacter thailandicus]
MSEIIETSASIHTFRNYRNRSRNKNNTPINESINTPPLEEITNVPLEEEIPVSSDDKSVTEFDIKSISVDINAREYFQKNGINSIEDAFNIANILHANKSVREAAVIYGLGFRLHSKEPNKYPLAQTFLQKRLLCLLKAGVEPPRHEIDLLRGYNIPYANYIEGIALAWRENKGEEALKHMKNAYEEFHTGEEIDRLYFEIVLKSAPQLLDPTPEAERKEKIPNNLFMYWDKSPPPEVLDNFAIHKNMKQFNLRIFDKEEATEWLYSNYGVEARSIFLNARNSAEAADILRVHVTQLYGGWWMNADHRIRDEAAADFMTSQDASDVFFVTGNNVIHTDCYGTIPGSMIGEDCLLSLYRNCYLHPVMFTAYKTGSGVFNRAVNRRIWRKIQGFNIKETLKIYDEAAFDKVIYKFPLW